MPAQTRFDLGQGQRRPVGRQHHPASVLDQGGQGRQQFFLGRGLAADELDIVDQQHVGIAQTVLEGSRLAVLHGLDEGRQEALGRQINHPGLGPQALGLPRDGVQEVGLAEAIGAAQENRIEMAVGPGRDLSGNGQGKRIAVSLDEAVERQAVLQAGGAHGPRTVGHRADRRGRHGLEPGRGRGRGGPPLHRRGRRHRPHFGPAADLKPARQAVQAQPQLIDAAQGILAHPVAGIGGGRDQDQLARAVHPDRRGRDIGAERSVADFRTQPHGRLRPDPVRIGHRRRLARHHCATLHHASQAFAPHPSPMNPEASRISGTTSPAPKSMCFSGPVRHSNRHLPPTRNLVPRRLHPCWDGSAMEVQTTPATGSVNADSRAQTQLNLLTPLKPFHA